MRARTADACGAQASVVDLAQARKARTEPLERDDAPQGAQQGPGGIVLDLVAARRARATRPAAQTEQSRKDERELLGVFRALKEDGRRSVLQAALSELAKQHRRPLR